MKLNNKKHLLSLLLITAMMAFAPSCSKTTPETQPQEKQQEEQQEEEDLREVVSYDLRNDSVKKYMNFADYTDDCGPDGYNITYADRYYRNTGETDIPAPVTIEWGSLFMGEQATFRLYKDEAKTTYKDYSLTASDEKISIYNLIPGRLYYYDILNEAGEQLDSWKFKTEGQVRMIKLGEVFNVRDIGGWESAVFKHEDGTPKHIKYNIIFRGSALNEKKTTTPIITDAEKDILLNDLGIQAEVDFRTAEENGIGGVQTDKYWLGNSVVYKWSESQSYKGLWGDGGELGNSYELTKTASRAVYEQAKAGRVIYYHCNVGRDRTGIQTWLIMGLCGVSESNMSKEYELTNFFTRYNTLRNNSSYLQDAVRRFWKNEKIDLQGTTIQEKCNDWFIKAGFTQDELDWYIDYLLE